MLNTRSKGLSGILYIAIITKISTTFILLNKDYAYIVPRDLIKMVVLPILIKSLYSLLF